jgi:hypothetical protein
MRTVLSVKFTVVFLELVVIAFIFFTKVSRLLPRYPPQHAVPEHGS